MDLNQAITEIKALHKPYTHASPVMTQQSYSKMIKRIENGTAKESAIAAFLVRFGYKINITVV